jgi:hypothetical protein
MIDRYLRPDFARRQLRAEHGMAGGDLGKRWGHRQSLRPLDGMVKQGKRAVQGSARTRAENVIGIHEWAPERTDDRVKHHVDGVGATVEPGGAGVDEAEGCAGDGSGRLRCGARIGHDGGGKEEEGRAGKRSTATGEDLVGATGQSDIGDNRVDVCG